MHNSIYGPQVSNLRVEIVALLCSIVRLLEVFRLLSLLYAAISVPYVVSPLSISLRHRRLLASWKAPRGLEEKASFLEVATIVNTRSNPPLASDNPRSHSTCMLLTRMALGTV